VDNEVGHLLEDFIMQGGVDTDFIQWRADDGIGRGIRNGLNFTERCFGIRGAVGVSARGNSAASQLKPDDFDWDRIFRTIGTRWLHTGGIFAALSETTAALAIEAVKALHDLIYSRCAVV
jgi:2-dehydro-3-deoxygluconokinase